MRPTALTGRRARLTIGVGLTLSAFCAATLYFVLDERPLSNTDRIIVVAAQRSARSEQAAKMPMSRTEAGDAATEQPGRNRAGNDDLPSLHDLSGGTLLVAKDIGREPRDGGWADPTERDIRSMMAAVPYVEPNTNLQVMCRETLCRAQGAITASSASQREFAANYIRDREFYRGQSEINALPQSIKINQTGDGLTFEVVFSRLHK